MALHIFSIPCPDTGEGAVLPPIIFGAMKQHTSSTAPASRKEALRVPPPSSNRESMPSEPSFVTMSLISTLPPFDAHCRISTPLSRSSSAFLAMLSEDIKASVVAIIVLCSFALLTMLQSRGVEMLLSTMILIGWCAFFSEMARRHESEGLSANTVPTPATMPERSFLILCTSCREESEETHFESPE